MAPSAIPDKQYFRIGEVAKIAGVRPSVLRYWETEFPTIRPTKSRSNQRVYTRRSVEEILKIRELLYERRYTIAGARKVLRQGEEGPGAFTDAAPAADLTVLRRVRDEVRELLRLVDE